MDQSNPVCELWFWMWVLHEWLRFVNLLDHCTGRRPSFPPQKPEETLLSLAQSCPGCNRCGVLAKW